MAKFDLSMMEIPDYNPNTEQTQQSNDLSNWPKTFPKTVIGLERKNVITESDSIKPLPGALEALRDLRLKGYKVVLIMDESGKDQQFVDKQNNDLMNVFGEAGIFSINAMYYSIGIDKKDIYVKPSTGMFKRCENENPEIKFRQGWYVGHNIKDAKAAFKIGARPALINPSEEEIKKLNSFSNQKVKKKTKIFKSLQDFANTLK